jgi:hypothetical protein
MHTLARSLIFLTAFALLGAAAPLQAQWWDCQDCGVLTQKCLKTGGDGATFCVEDPGAGCLLFGSCSVTSAREIAPDGFRISREVAAATQAGAVLAMPTRLMTEFSDFGPEATRTFGSLDCGGYLREVSYSTNAAITRRASTSYLRL